MANNKTRPSVVADIEQYIDSVLERSEESGLGVAREIMRETQDRWYGLLLVDSYSSVTDRADQQAIIPAAVAMEFLRGYVRNRSMLLVQLGDTMPHSFTGDPADMLLAGDYLKSVAYSVFARTDHKRLDTCFRRLSSANDRLVRTFTDFHARSLTSEEYISYLEGTSGVLGGAAAEIGATLGDANPRYIESFATFGQQLATYHLIQRSLETNAGSLPISPPDGVETRFRTYAQDRLYDLEQTLSDLPPGVSKENIRVL